MFGGRGRSEINDGGLTAATLVGGLCASLGANAQLNLVGYWDPIFHEDVEERIPGPSIGDYLGLPISDAARWRAESWDASLLSLPEHQCKPHPSTYGFRGVGTLRIWEERDPASAGAREDPHVDPVAVAAPRDLDGRPRASARVRASTRGKGSRPGISKATCWSSTPRT